MKKDQIFWVVWAVVVAGAGAFQFLVVGEMRSENRETLTRGRYLAARFRPEGEITKGIQHLLASSAADKKAFPKPKVLDQEALTAIGNYLDREAFDKKLFQCYPLSQAQNLRSLPSRQKLDDYKSLNQDLARARAEFVNGQFPRYSFQADPGLDFKPVAPGPSEYIPFRYWVRDQDMLTDAAFARAAGKEVEIAMLPADLVRQNVALSWNPDGKVTGWIRDDGLRTVPEDREKVLRRLLLRRELLLAIARAKVPVDGLERAGGDAAEEPRRQLRGVDRIISLKFVDPPRQAPKVCYLAHGVEIEVCCHPAVVTALLREIEAIGQSRKDRPYAFWADRLIVRRVSGWPGADLAGELRSDAQYGRHNEWPVIVRFSGIVPEFTDKNDPEPKK